MTKTSVYGRVFALFTLGLLLSGAFATFSHADEDHETARRALERGEILPITQILLLAQAAEPGEIIQVELEREHGHFIYEIKVLTPNGRVVELEMDAKSGKVLSKEDD